MRAYYDKTVLSGQAARLNHAQKRLMGKRVRKQIRSIKDLKEAVGVVEAYDVVNAEPTIKPGDTVMLDYERITSHKDYDTYNPKYRDFIEANKDKCFTTEAVPNKPYRNIFQFVEDESAVKWYFVGDDLVKVECINQAEEEVDEFEDDFDDEDDEIDTDLDDYDD